MEVGTSEFFSKGISIDKMILLTYYFKIEGSEEKPLGQVFGSGKIRLGPAKAAYNRK
jgi:hypothetical protein